MPAILDRARRWRAAKEAMPESSTEEVKQKIDKR
jgi:hypothetical protein